MAADDDEMENEACVGGLCFLQPHSGYFPPPFYRRIPGRVGVLFCLSPSVFAAARVCFCEA
jgi:hypothetical protein